MKKFKKGTVCSAATVVTFQARTTESLLAGLKSFNPNHRQFVPVALLPHRSSSGWIKPETRRFFKNMNCYCYFYLFNSNPIINDSNPLFPSKCQTIFLYKYRQEGEKPPSYKRLNEQDRTYRDQHTKALSGRSSIPNFNSPF